MKQAAEVDFDYLNSPRCENSIVEIQNNSIYTDDYIWKLNGQIVSRDRHPDFEIDNLVENTVTLIGSNLTCTDSTTEVIEPASLRELLQLKDANVFTPNGDGLNDIFDPGFEGEFIGCVDFQIFDRWGEKSVRLEYWSVWLGWCIHWEEGLLRLEFTFTLFVSEPKKFGGQSS